MALRNTFKQHTSDDSNQLLDLKTTIEQRIQQFASEEVDIKQQITKLASDFKTATSDHQKKEIREKMVPLLRRKKIIEKRLEFYRTELYNVDLLTFAANIGSEKVQDSNPAPYVRSNLKSVTLGDDNISHDKQDILVKEINSINDMINELDPLPDNDNQYLKAFAELEREFIATQVPLNDILTDFDASSLNLE